MEAKLRVYYEVTHGPLAGTVMEPIGAFIAVKYPHRKTKDLYVPPISDERKGVTSSWHCCQANCPEPDFHGAIKELLIHLELHAGRLLKKRKAVNM